MSGITDREYNQLKESMDEVKRIVTDGFKETNSSIKKIENDFTGYKLQTNERLNSHVTYKQVISFGAWFVGVLIACVGTIAAFFSLK